MIRFANFFRVEQTNIPSYNKQAFGVDHAHDQRVKYYHQLSKQTFLQLNKFSESIILMINENLKQPRDQQACLPTTNKLLKSITFMIKEDLIQPRDQQTRLPTTNKLSELITLRTEEHLIQPLVNKNVFLQLTSFRSRSCL